MAKRIRNAGTQASLGAPVKRVLTDVPDDWLTLVEQIAELEDILLECGASHDQDADHGRAWLQDLLVNKRRQLRRIDVGVEGAMV